VPATPGGRCEPRRRARLEGNELVPPRHAELTPSRLGLHCPDEHGGARDRPGAWLALHAARQVFALSPSRRAATVRTPITPKTLKRFGASSGVRPSSHLCSAWSRRCLPGLPLPTDGPWNCAPIATPSKTPTRQNRPPPVDGDQCLASNQLLRGPHVRHASPRCIDA
jgi:hypothetical protein